ncbi:hypothetical protein L7F22_027952 [Adiantum nelumboides]|nr:hypothetical protein [Adiantum nelumboides]
MSTSGDTIASCSRVSADTASGISPPYAAFLDWPTRYNTALKVARGLKYLHKDCEHPILHFNIKSQNILLDGAFVAKLADFGMARPLQVKSTPQENLSTFMTTFANRQQEHPQLDKL